MRGVRNRVTVGVVAAAASLGLLTWGAVVAAPAGADPTTVTFTENGTFTVPDGIHCLGIEAEGGEGGAGATDTASGGNGGLGGRVNAFVVVEPGAELPVFLGSKGVDGVSGGGGAGGGATAVVFGAEPILIAGGGGGGGAAEGTNAGGEGGDGGNADSGRNGSAGAAGSATAGTAGTESGAGLAGTNDGAGAAPTAGADTPPEGGVGGQGPHGGGSGGSGFFGGGGGGSGESTPGAGGGGGGSAVNPGVFPSTGYAWFEDGVNEGDGEVTFFFDATTESCLQAPLIVKKSVVGAVAPGTTFTVHVACRSGALVVPLGGAGSPTERDLVFSVDTDGVVQPSSGYTLGFSDPDSCTVTETVDGGASGVSYACESVIVPVVKDVEPAVILDPPADICSTAGPTDTPITVNVVTEGQRVLVTLTNTFDPTFTG